MARNADSGYSTSDTSTEASSSVVYSGVAPNSVMLARIGAFTRSAKVLYICNSVMASGKIMSAPASMQAAARSSAAFRPSTARASVRAMITKLSSLRASTAALMRSTISCWLTISLFGRWPQRLAPTWSSIWMAAAPNLLIERTVRATLKAEAPKPVSTSTSSGRSHTSVMRRTSVSTSSRPVMPRSGRPREPAATPPPDR
ncbi:hypothetical protein D9M71_636370 [compost metagenome]